MSATLSSPTEAAGRFPTTHGGGTSAPYGAVVRCRHFGSCGGCSLQDKIYDVQLELKKEKVLAALAGVESLPVLSLVPAPELWNYRNKMEFSFGDVYPPIAGRWLKLGLKPRGRWHTILDLEECHLPAPQVAGLLTAVRSWAQRERVPPYNSHKKEGVLRHLVVREAKNHPERMVLLVTTNGDIPKQSFVDAVLCVYPATTILVGVNAKASDTAIPDSLQILTGSGHITETLNFLDGSLDYRISPQSFFQTNTKGAEVLYGLLRAWTAALSTDCISRSPTVLDLYCGGGAVALSLAGAARKVIGVELNCVAVADAKANAQRNGIVNCDFYCAAVERMLPSLLDMGPDVVVVDPPRVGLHALAAATLIEMAPPLIFYISCNPESLGRDLKILGAHYSVDRLVAVDLFPHTDHVETVVRLVRT